MNDAREPRNEAGDATHEWSSSIAPLWDVCAKCGIVRRADRLHRACPGHPPVIATRGIRCNGGRS